jgi:hypothetical protein
MEASFAGEPRDSRQGAPEDTAPGTALAMYGALCRRLEASWHVLRHCRISIKGEEYVLQLVIVHRDFGIGLIAFRAEQYTFPELAIRLTRDLLRRHGFHERFSGHLPVVFIAADPKDAPDMPVRIARAFADERRIEVSDPLWAEWAARLLGRTASEGRQGDTGGTTPDSPIDMDAPKNEAAAAPKSPRRSGRLLALAAAPLLLGGGIAGAFASGLLGISVWPAGGHAEATLSARPTAAVLRPAAGVRDCSARLMSEARTASYLGLDTATFQARRAALQSAGFPEPEPITGGYDRAAIDRWLDRRIGMN